MDFSAHVARFDVMTDFPLNHDGFPPYKKKVYFRAHVYFQPNIPSPQKLVGR